LPISHLECGEELPELVVLLIVGSVDKLLADGAVGLELRVLSTALRGATEGQ